VKDILHGANAGLAKQHAQDLASTSRYTYMSPYNDEQIISRQGTIAFELFEQLEKSEDCQTLVMFPLEAEN
jgi:threonine dehydratase